MAEDVGAILKREHAEIAEAIFDMFHYHIDAREVIVRPMISNQMGGLCLAENGKYFDNKLFVD